MSREWQVTMGMLCIITARGGSKRIPKKNVRDFCGKPIIAYSIEAALKSGRFEEVMVSTDDSGIAGIARECGASVPFLRSEKNSDDFATTSDVIVEVLEEYEARGRTFEAVCCIYPTAPFVTADKLCEAIDLFESTNSDAVLTATRFSFPPQRGMVERDGKAEWWMPEFERSRSQDLEPVYHDAGQFYIRSVSALRATKSMLGPITRLYEVSEMEVQDIDNETDWQIAEMKYERMMA